jgi:hypothetical protein
MASIDSLIHLMTSSSEVILVLGSSGTPWIFGWATHDVDGTVIPQNNFLKVRIDLKNRLFYTLLNNLIKIVLRTLESSCGKI